MIRFSKHRIDKEADSIIIAWTRDYSTYLLKKKDLDRDSEMYADRFVCQFNLSNANKVTLAVWRQFRHVLPVKGDVRTANIKRMSNAVRRHIAQAKETRANINKTVKALSSETPPAYSRD